MARKSKRNYEDYELDPEWGFAFDEEGDEQIDEEMIVDLCGKRNAQLGIALYRAGAITQRSLAGDGIRGTVQEGERFLPLLVDPSDFTTICTHMDHARQRNPRCEHIAALLYAFVYEPSTFVPIASYETEASQRTGNVAGIGGARAQAIGAAPQSLVNASVVPLAAEENVPLPPSPIEDLKFMLQNLAPEQLRAIAKRRGWKLIEAKKGAMVKQVADLISKAPQPAEYSPEEEQLLRIVNTIDGLATDPVSSFLDRLWKKHGGSDLNRLHRAVEGLALAGVLFPCAHDGTLPHFHWSPFAVSENLPLLAPRTKLYPGAKVDHLQQRELPPALVSLVDAMLELAEREPLHFQTRTLDDRLTALPFVGDWDYDPQELEPLLKSNMRGQVPSALTVRFSNLYTDDTNRTLQGLAGAEQGLGEWVAGVLFLLGILELAEDGSTRINKEKQERWRAQSPDMDQRVLWHVWRSGALPLTELRQAAARAGFVVQRSTHDTAFTADELLVDIGFARAFITRLLKPLDPLTWYSWKSFCDQAHELRPDFLHTFTDEQTWFLVDNKLHFRYKANDSANWEAAMRPILAAMLEGPFRWLGMVNIAYEGKEIASFQITTLGQWLLSNGQVGSFAMPALADMGTEPIRWTGDSTFRLNTTQEAMRLLPVARAFAEPGRELNSFRITSNSLTRAIESGATVAEIAEKFQSAGTKLPAALRERMDALATSYGRIHLYEHLTVLELADDFALRELTAATSLAKYIVHRFSPRLVVVRDEGVDTLVEEMGKKGYTPRVVDHEPKNHGK